MVKDPSANAETWVQPHGWKDPLEKMVTPPEYSCLDPIDQRTGGLQSRDVKGVRHN